MQSEDEAGSAPDVSHEGSGSVDQQSEHAEDDRVARLCASLFQWSCVNCACPPSGVAQPTPEMLAFAAAVDRRLLAQRELSVARAAHGARLREHADAVEARRAAAAAAADAASRAAQSLAGGVGDVDVDVTTRGPVGGVAHAHVHVHSTAPGSAVEVTASVDTAPAPAVTRRDLLAAVASAIGLTRPPHGEQHARSSSSSSGGGGGDDGDELVAPTAPDFAAMIAALPSVPAPPPAVPRELLLAQACDECGAPFCDRTAATADCDAPAAAAAAAGVANAGDAADDDALGHEAAAGGGGAPAAAGAVTAARPVPSTNMSVLAITLQDDDPDDYIARFGLTPETIGAILRQPGCHSGGAACAAADAAGSEPPLPRTLHAQRLRAHPLQQAFEGGHGGFAPVTGLAYDERMLLHEEASRAGGGGSARGGGLSLAVPGVALPPPPPSQHPERPDRLRAIAQHLVATGLLQRCKRLACRPVEEAELEGVHTGDYRAMIASLDHLVAEGGGDLHFGSDTFANEHTLAAAKLACGSVVAVTEAVLNGRVDRAVALVRPPGHHAEPDSAIGFCIYNNVAVAAWVATRKLGVKRVLIVDWDVHHGNGTQHMFEDDPSVLFMSLHRHDRGNFYPGTGAVREVGTGGGIGYTVNIPWDGPGAGDAEYAAAFDDVVMPVAHAYAPELVLVSAGFDAARGDPLGGCDLTPAGYAHMTHRLLALAGGRLVVALEGGYNLASISRGMESVLRVMLGQAPPPLHLLPARTHTAAAVAAAAAGGSSGSGGGGVAAAAASFLDAAAARARVGATPSGDSAGSLAPGDAAAAGSGGALRAQAPRGDSFEPTALALADMETEFEGVDRGAILEGAAPASSALRTIASVLAAHAPHWPVLQAKHRAYRRLLEAEQLAAARASGGLSSAPFAAGLSGAGAGGAGAAPWSDEEEEEDDDARGSGADAGEEGQDGDDDEANEDEEEGPEEGRDVRDDDDDDEGSDDDGVVAGAAAAARAVGSPAKRARTDQDA